MFWAINILGLVVSRPRLIRMSFPNQEKRRPVSMEGRSAATRRHTAPRWDEPPRPHQRLGHRYPEAKGRPARESPFPLRCGDRAQAFVNWAAAAAALEADECDRPGRFCLFGSLRCARLCTLTYRNGAFCRFDVTGAAPAEGLARPMQSKA